MKAALIGGIAFAAGFVVGGVLVAGLTIDGQMRAMFTVAFEHGRSLAELRDQLRDEMRAGFASLRNEHAKAAPTEDVRDEEGGGV